MRVLKAQPAGRSRASPPICQEREWPNLGGERVVRKDKPKAAQLSSQYDAATGVDALGEFSGRRLVLGLLVSATAVSVNQLAANVQPRFGAIGGGANRNNELSLEYEGDAVSVPFLETKLAEVTAKPASAEKAAEVEELVELLERREGSQFFASSGRGRWVLPWVGGWERIWTSELDASFLGGPPRASLRLSTENGSPSLSAGSAPFSQIGARHFIYGPGEGGITIEYLYESPEAKQKLLLERTGAVTNLGGNYFSLTFPSELTAFAAESIAPGQNKLSTGVPLPGRIEGGGPREPITLHTTYLSERLWVLRDEALRLCIFQRTETRSVMDRRGLVAEGQLKPPADETIRYGRLLFGESQQDYQGWEDKAGSQSSNTDKLLGR